MLGIEYFKNRLIDIYSYSLMPYICGQGSFKLSGFTFKVYWEAVILVDGSMILVLSLPKLPSHGSSDIFKGKGVLSGETDDGLWKICATDVLVTDISFKVDEKVEAYFTCRVTQFNIVKKSKDNCLISHIEGHILNFDFLGWEVTETSKGSTLDKFTISAYEREITFRQSEHMKEIIKYIRAERIDRAILSSVTIPVAKGETRENIETYLRKLTLFLSFAYINSIVSPVVKYWDNASLVGISFRNLVSAPYHRHRIVDNDLVFGGLIHFFRECYDNFLALDEEINLWMFVNHLWSIHIVKYLEHRLALLVISYEYFLSKYLAYLGWDSEKVKNMDVQSKLKKINYYLRFISSDLLSDKLRDGVRNPLFHVGELPHLAKEEMWDVYSDYYDLLVQVILRVLGYTGQYISPKDHKVVDLI